MIVIFSSNFGFYQIFLESNLENRIESNFYFRDKRLGMLKLTSDPETTWMEELSFGTFNSGDSGPQLVDKNNTIHILGD